jgi:hypothetical protein
MKSISCLLILCLVAVFAVNVSATQVVINLTDVADSVRLEDRTANSIDAGTYMGSYSITYAGDYENALDTSNRIQKGGFLFRLPDMVAGQMLVSATLRSYLIRIDGTPAGNTAVYHLGDVTQWAISDFEAAGVVADSDFATSASSKGSYYEGDVTSAVLYDYLNDAAGQVASAFRLQAEGALFPIGDDGNNLSDRYLWYGSDATNPAQLVLEFSPVPEPATAGILALGMYFSTIIKRKRSVK